MIRFLNGGSVAGYARLDIALPSDLPSTCVTQEDACFRRADEPVLLGPCTGMAVLQIEQTSGKIDSYYLDKAVLIHPGVAFCILPLDAPCAVYIHTEGIAEPVPGKTADPLERPAAAFIDRIYTFFDQRQGPGFLFPGERHQPYELVCVLEGCLHNIVGGKEYTVAAHQAIILPPDTWHTQYADEAQGVHFITVAFHAARPLPAASLLCPFLLSRVSAALLQEMAQDLTDDRLQEKRLLCGLQFLLMPWLIHGETQPVGGRTADAARHENELLDHLLEYIATHAQEGVTVAAIARNSGVSVPYLSQLFRRYLHVSPGAYLQHVRLEQAGRMLRHGAGTVTQIAGALHFSSPQHFCTAFKKHYGVTPLQYAKGKRL